MKQTFLRLSVLTMAALLVAACSHTPAAKKATRSARAPAAPRAAAPIRVTPEPDSYEYEDGLGRYEDRGSRSQAFYMPPELEPQVGFWQKVYTVWRRSQAAIHDDRYLDVVYEVVEFPDDVGDSLTPDQKSWLAERRDYWKIRLSALEDKVAGRQPVSADDREIIEMLGNGRLTGAADRVRSQRGMRERFKRGLEISRRYERTFRKIFRDAGLPEDLAYLPHVESSFQAAAKSSAGAVGIWQFTRAAAEKFMTINDRVDERLDPVASARGAARYLSNAYSRLGTWPLALTSYNHGLNGMRRAQSLFGDDFMRIVEEYDHPLFGFASRNFYAEFLAAREIARDPERFFGEDLRH